MAPLTNEIRPVENCFPPHLGPVIPEVSSIWFKMFLYHTCHSGPPSLLLPRGYKISRLPKIFEQYGRLLITTWGHDPSEIPLSGALAMLIEALQHSAVLVQAHSAGTEANSAEIWNVPFPLSTEDQERLEREIPAWKTSDGQKMLPPAVDIRNACGYISLLNLEVMDDNNESSGAPKNGEMNEANATLLQEEVDNVVEDGRKSSKSKQKMSLLNDNEFRKKWMLLDIKFGVPLFDSELNRTICQGIVINSLWKKESLEVLKKSGQDLTQLINDFILNHQDLPLNDANAKMWTTPEERRKSPIPMPTRVLFFDGHTLHEKI